MEDWMPNHLAGLLKKIPRPQWFAFAGVWAAGLFAHGYMLTNKLPNHDDLAACFNKGTGLSSGRWGLEYVGMLDGSFSSSWMLGLFTLFLLAAAAMLITAMMEIKAPLPAFLAGGIIAVFPTVTSMFAYMFTSDAYAISVLLAVLAAWLCRRKSRLWLIPAVACIVGSLSIYQGFFGFAAALLVYGLYVESTGSDADAKKILVDGIWQAGTLAAGMVSYLGITKWLLAKNDVKLNGYMYLDRMGEVHPSLIPGQIVDAWRMFFSRWNKELTLGITTMTILRRLLGGCALLLAVLLAAGVVRQCMRKKWLEAALAALLALLFPVAVNIICLMNSSSIHTLMVYPMCLVPVTLLARSEGWNAHPFSKGSAALPRLAGSWAAAGCVALLVLQYGMLDNEAYLQMQLNHTRRISYWTAIVAQIRALPEYDPSLPVALVGEESEDPNLPAWWHNHDLERMCGVDLRIRQGTDERFLNLYLAYAPNFVNAYEAWELPEVQAMPSYPYPGSIAVVDGMIVVKIGALEP